MKRQPRIECTCQQCGKTFIQRIFEGKRFCSNKCSGLARQKQVHVKCATCGKEFSIKPFVLKPKNWCSWDCHKASLRGAVKSTPEWAAKAAEMYKRGDGCPTISKALGVNRDSVSRWVKRMGAFELGRKPTNQNKNQRNMINKLIMSDYRREQSSVSGFDEQCHWGCLWRRKRNKQNVTRNYYISKLLRSRVRRVLSGELKSAPTLKLLGCSIDQFRLHLQALFTKGMNWNNQGLWHIDHIIPCSSFDLSKPEEQRKCFHFSNMRPMWANENISKHDSVIACQPELLLCFETNKESFA